MIAFAITAVKGVGRCYTHVVLRKAAIELVDKVRKFSWTERGGMQRVRWRQVIG